MNKHISIKLEGKGKVFDMSILEYNNLKKEIEYNEDSIEIEIASDDKDIDSNEQVSTMIVDLIIDILKKEKIKYYIAKKYSKETKEQVQNLYLSAIKVFDQREKYIRKRMYNKVYSYITNNNYINVDGFIKFRMKELAENIPNIVDLAVEEYLMKKDQDEFINVLKYFIDIQDKKVDLLRILINKDKTFMFYDKNGKIIDNSQDNEIIEMALEENLSYQDLLISNLLTLCPENIEIIDNLKDDTSKEVIDTIKSIFGDKAKCIYQH